MKLRSYPEKKGFQEQAEGKLPDLEAGRKARPPYLEEMLVAGRKAKLLVLEEVLVAWIHVHCPEMSASRGVLPKALP